MLYEHRGKRPVVDPSAYVAPSAVLCGEVQVGPGYAIGFGAVLSAESGSIAIGRECVIMENVVIRASKRAPVRIGDHVLIGPRAYLTGCTTSPAPSSRPGSPSSITRSSERAPRCGSTGSSI
jgi:carbonic anhydrase/acetyltransferase-like protein (isoleucine patch superfamily)